MTDEHCTPHLDTLTQGGLGLLVGGDTSFSGAVADRLRTGSNRHGGLRRDGSWRASTPRSTNWPALASMQDPRHATTGRVPEMLNRLLLLAGACLPAGLSACDS